VARFLQRAGRSGHQPDAESTCWFLPTHSLELIEAAALKEAIAISLVESRQPLLLCFDVLLQYMCTLAVSDGFYPDEIFEEVRTTSCFRDITKIEWEQLLQFITAGGIALNQYDEFKKVEVIDGLYKINNRRVAMRHRMHIGTIVSDPMLKVKFLSGGYIGVIEEYFISRLQPGDVFTLAGKNLEFILLKDMTVIVKKSNSKKSIIPSWQGGRMSLSANLGFMLRKKLDEASLIYSVKVQAIEGNSLAGGDTDQWGNNFDNIGTLGNIGTTGPGDNGFTRRKEPNPSPLEKLFLSFERKEDKDFLIDEEIIALKPLFELQRTLSHIPKSNELLIEHIETKDGFHLFIYPFEGRLVHEAMAALLAFRISRITPITFSIAMNDYGFELLSDQPVPLDDSNVYELFSEEHLFADIQRSVNASEMARRKFRDIAVIGGLIFQGMPGEAVKQKHLQSSASLLFNVFTTYEPGNLLLRQAYHEVMEQQMDEPRLRNMLQRIQQSKIIITFPQQLTPFCFPIKADSLRDSISSEKLEDRVRKLLA
jgi:ATP-dependent Lhr-like helicase